MLKSTGTILSRSSYRELLAKPRWKSFSADIKQRKGNLCECCRLSGKATQVHHIFYDGRSPWDYEVDEVVLLCNTCHRELHEELKRFRKLVFGHLKPQSFRALNEGLAIGLKLYDSLVFARAICEFATNHRLVENHAKAWGLTTDGKAIAND